MAVVARWMGDRAADKGQVMEIAGGGCETGGVRWLLMDTGRLNVM